MARTEKVTVPCSHSEVKQRVAFTQQGSVRATDDESVKLSYDLDLAQCDYGTTSISNLQWSLEPHSSTPLRARTRMFSWNPREANT